MGNKSLESVDIFKFPGKSLPTGQQVTIGDMHANAIKFLFFLVQEGAITLTKEAYDNAVAIYQAHAVTLHQVRIFYKHQKTVEEYTKDLEKISREIAELETNLKDQKALNSDGTENNAYKELAPKLKGKKTREQHLMQELQNSKDYLGKSENKLTSISAPLGKQLIDFCKHIETASIQNKSMLIRLIGDELADRGVSDVFILYIYRMLIKKEANISTLLSNHGVEFLIAYNKALGNNDTSNYYTSATLGEPQAQSLYALREYIDLNVLTQKDIEQLVTDSGYIKTIKIIDYSITPDGGIALYSHAPIDIALIKSMAKYLDVTFEDASPIHLAKTIDAINIAFQNKLLTGDKLSALLGKPKNVDKLTNVDKDENPVVFALWNRNYSIIQREPTHNNYVIKYIHGHDPMGEQMEHVLNLDNALGKFLNSNIGRYTTENNNGFTLSQLSPEQLSIINQHVEADAAVNALIERLAEPIKSGLSKIAGIERTREKIQKIAIDGELTLVQKIAQITAIAKTKEWTTTGFYKNILSTFDEYQKKIASLITQASNIAGTTYIDSSTLSTQPKPDVELSRTEHSIDIGEGEDPLTQPEAAKAPPDAADASGVIEQTKEAESSDHRVWVSHDLSALRISNVVKEYTPPNPKPLAKTNSSQKKPGPFDLLSTEQQDIINHALRTAIQAPKPRHAAYLLSMISALMTSKITDVSDIEGFDYQATAFAWDRLTTMLTEQLAKADPKEERVEFWLKTLAYLDNVHDSRSVLGVNAALDSVLYSKNGKSIFANLSEKTKRINETIAQKYAYASFVNDPKQHEPYYNNTPIIAITVSYYKKKMINAKEGLGLAQDIIKNINRALHLLPQDKIKSIIATHKNASFTEQERSDQIAAIFASISLLSPADIQTKDINDKDKQLSPSELAEKTKKEFLLILTTYSKELTPTGANSDYDMLISFRDNEQKIANLNKATIETAQQHLDGVKMRAKNHLAKIQPNITSTLTTLKEYSQQHQGQKHKHGLANQLLAISEDTTTTEDKLNKLSAIIKSIKPKQDRQLLSIAQDLVNQFQARMASNQLAKIYPVKKLSKEPEPAKKAEPEKSSALLALEKFLSQHTNEEIIENSILLRKFTALTQMLTWDLDTKKIITSGVIPSDREIQIQCFLEFEAALSNDSVFIEANFTRESLYLMTPDGKKGDKLKRVTEEELRGILSDLDKRPNPNPKYSLDLSRIQESLLSAGLSHDELNQMPMSLKFKIEAAMFYAQGRANERLLPFSVKLSPEKPEEFQEFGRIKKLISEGSLQLIKPFVKNHANPEYQEISTCLRELIQEQDSIEEAHLPAYNQLLDKVTDIISSDKENKKESVLVALETTFKAAIPHKSDPKEWREEVKKHPDKHVFEHTLSSLMEKLKNPTLLTNQVTFAPNR